VATTRAAAATVPAGDKPEVTPVDLDAFQRSDRDQNIALQNGDTIVSPRAAAAFVGDAVHHCNIRYIH